MSATNDGSSSPRSQLLYPGISLHRRRLEFRLLEFTLLEQPCLPLLTFCLSSKFFEEMLDSIIVDVASECHRIARLGLDRSLDNEEEELRLSVEARASDPSISETNGKNVVDIFGQTHPPIASEIFECMNCGRPVVAGRFAPHLEKCMGKGRKARQKTTRSTTMAQNRHSRGSPVSVYAPYSTNTSRAHNGSSSAIGEYSNYAFEGP